MTFSSIYDEMSCLVDKMNVGDNRNESLYQLMEYLCTHVNELIQHFDYRLTAIIQSIYYKILEKDVLKRLDEYLERLEPFFLIQKIKDKEENKEYDLTYWGYKKEKPPHYEQMKLLIQYVDFVMLKVWPEKSDIDVKNINTFQDFYRLSFTLGKDCW